MSIVGPGRLGQALGRLLKRAGVPVLFVAARRRGAGERAVQFIGSGRPVDLRSGRLTEAPVILLTTADSALAQVARELAGVRSDWSGKIVLHTCGSLPATVLKPLRRKGAAIGSLHPFQTIPNPKAGARNLIRCFWAIEGDAAAREVASGWIKALDGVAFTIPASKRILYHTAAFLVSPTVVTLMDRSARLLRRAGVPAEIARPMLGGFVSETVRNFVNLGGRRALTGPAVRGDWLTIRGHLCALRRFAPDLVPVYRELLRAMLHLAQRRQLPRLVRM